MCWPGFRVRLVGWVRRWIGWISYGDGGSRRCLDVASLGPGVAVVDERRVVRMKAETAREVAVYISALLASA